MRDQWYGDSRDLVKWGTLLELARRFGCGHILQVLYYRPTVWPRIEIDGKEADVASEVIRHFRNVEAVCGIQSDIKIEVLRQEFSIRSEYLLLIGEAIRLRSKSPGIVFLDPDTGLEPHSGRFGLTHVLENEIQSIWELLSPSDLLVFYQHEDNKAGMEWIERKRHQFASAIGLQGSQHEKVKVARAPKIARDVALFFIQKG